MTFIRMEAQLASGGLPYLVGGSGPALLYLHSTAGVQVTPAVTALAERHRLFLPVMPGFDDTPVQPGVTTLDALVALTAQFVTGVICGRCDVIGHSFGGWLAMRFAVQHPELVDQLVLEAPSGLRFGAGQAAGAPSPYAYPERAAAFVKPAAQLERNRAMRERYGAGQTVDAVLAARIGEITARTLILFGTRDGMIGSETGVFLKETIKASHLAYVYDAGHAIEIDQPDRFLRLVGAFLERGEAYIVNWGDGASKRAAGQA